MATINEEMSFINKSIFTALPIEVKATSGIYTGSSVEGKAISGKTLLFRKRIDNPEPNRICLGSPYDVYHNTESVLNMETKHIIELSETSYKKES